MDMSLIQGVVFGLKTAGDIAKGFLKLKTLSEVQGKVIELQSVILYAQQSAIAAQSDQFAMLEELRALKERISQMKAWDEEKGRYKLDSAWPGSPILVYKLKKSMQATEKAHWICTKCYDDGKRSILQPQQDKAHWVTLFCATCKSDIHTRLRGIGAPDYAPE